MGYQRLSPAQAMTVIQRLASYPELDDQQRLLHLFELVPQYLAMAIGNTLQQRFGGTVQSGLFAGMTLPVDAGFVISPPQLLGTYELELQPHFRRLGQRNYEVMIDAGSADGYYVAGLGRLWNVPEILAFDIDESLHARCRAMAGLNGIGDRVRYGGAFDPSVLEGLAGRRTFLLCDIEGAEFGMIDARRNPALRTVDIVIELHPTSAHAVAELTDSFAETHDVTMVRPMHRPLDPPACLDGMSEIQKLVALCEFRGAENPWAVMTCKVWP